TETGWGLSPLRPFVRVDQPMPSPSDPREPRPCDGDRSRSAIGSRTRCPPTREPCGRGARIDLGAAVTMLLEIHQNVHERVAYRARAGERPGVVATVPDGAPAT